MPSRKRSRDRNRGSIFVDFDNVDRTFQEYGIVKTCNRLFDWIADEQNLGLTQISQICYFGSYHYDKRLLPEETLLERRLNLNIHHHAYPRPRNVPGYEDEVILAEMKATRHRWDTAVLVMSDHKAFEWANAIHFNTEEYSDKEVVVIYSHLSTRRDYASRPRNGVSLEQIFPDLNRRFCDLRGYNPLKYANSLPA